MKDMVGYLFLTLFLLLQLSILPFSVAWSQKGWRTITKNDGLPDNTITSIAEDLDGDIWIGTPTGLGQYTGFITVPVRTPVMKIQIVENHPIWYIVGGAQYSNVSNTVVQAVGDGWKVHQIMVDKVRGVISDLLVTPEGIVWVTTNEGIKTYDGSQWKTIKFEGDWPTKIAQGKDGTIWASGPQKVYRYQGGRFQPDKYTQDKVLNTPALLVASDGTVWIGTDVGLYSYSPAKGGTQHNLKGDGVNDIVEDSNRTIWIGTDRGVYSHNQGLWKSHLIDTDKLNDTTIYSLIIK